jgi:prepilin-type N-terminal cleavage/methylation domain-containing protein
LSIFGYCKGFMKNKIVSHPRCSYRSKNAVRRRGFTIVELLIALTLSGFVMSMVFYSWNYISHYTVTQQRKALFQSEANRIAQLIVAQIRKSPKVVLKSEMSVIFLSQSGLDTIAYEWTSETLKKNNVEIWCDSNSARLTQFSIKKEDPGIDIDSTKSTMLLLTIGFKDRFGDESVFPLKVKAAVSPDQFDSKGGREREWNF